MSIFENTIDLITTFGEIPAEIIGGIEHISDNFTKGVIETTQNIEDTAIGTTQNIEDTIVAVSSDIKEEVIEAEKQIGQSERQNIGKVAKVASTFIKYESIVWISTILLGTYLINNIATDPVSTSTAIELAKIESETAIKGMELSQETADKGLQIIKENPDLVQGVEDIVSGKAETDALGGIMGEKEEEEGVIGSITGKKEGETEKNDVYEIVEEPEEGPEEE